MEWSERASEQDVVVVVQASSKEEVVVVFRHGACIAERTSCVVWGRVAYHTRVAKQVVHHSLQQRYRRIIVFVCRFGRIEQNDESIEVVVVVVSMC